MQLAPTLRDTLATACVFAACNALLLLVSTLRAHLNCRPETTRKLLHLGMGLIALTFPFIFHSALPVLLINGTFLLLLTAQSTVGQRFLSAMRLRAGAFLPPEQPRSTRTSLYRRSQNDWHHLTSRVNRKTAGEFYFPLAIALLFLLTGNDPLLFCIPVLILTIADSAAALIGCHYGHHAYRTAAGRKSVEGSAAFFLSTFLLTQLPLLLFTSLSPTTAIVIAAFLALTMTIVEALSWNGLDNLLLPLASFALLNLLLRAAG